MLEDTNLYLSSVPNVLSMYRCLEILFGHTCELKDFLSLAILKKIKKAKLKRQKVAPSSNFIAQTCRPLEPSRKSLARLC